MRRPSLRLPHYAAIATMATTIAVLPLTSASAAFDDGDYDLSATCDVDATLKVRGNGNGISVTSDTTLAVGTERRGGEVVTAFLVDFGGDDVADDNTIYVIEPADVGGGLSCVSEGATDDEVTQLLGLGDEDDSAPSDDEVSAASDDEDSDLDEGSDDEAVERVEVCHKPETPAQATKDVNADALEAHLGHGDELGACAEGDESEESLSRKDAEKADRNAQKADRKAEKQNREHRDDETDNAAQDDPQD